MCLYRGSITFNTQCMSWQDLGRGEAWERQAGYPLPHCQRWCFWEIYWIFFLASKVEMCTNPEKRPPWNTGVVFLSHWRCMYTLHHDLLSADGVMFLLLCPIWVREWTQSQKSLHWQHLGTSSLPRQPTAWSILPSLILEGVCLLAQPEERNLALGSAFTVYLLPVPPGQVHLWQHTISVGDLKQLNLQVGDTPRVLGVWTRAGWRQKCLHCTQSWGQVAFQ